MAFPSYTKVWHDDVYDDIKATRPELSAKGKVIVITGGGSGIGAATVEAFALAGAAHIFVLGRTEKNLRDTQVKVEVKCASTKVTPLVTDVSNSLSINNAFNTIAETGRINVFVNNAAYLSDIGPIATASESEWWKASEVNILGSFNATRNFLKNAAPGAVLVNVSSAAAYVSRPGHSAYSVSKLGAAKFFEYIQIEHPDLNIFNLQPGVVPSTEMAVKSKTQSGLNFTRPDTSKLYLSF
jgi:NAD(P)-dependent dehydrogenase (short-subunit alcohol dehydrogenase family)